MTELAPLLGLSGDRSVLVGVKTPGTRATGNGARDALELVSDEEAATYRTAVGIIGYIVLDRPD